MDITAKRAFYEAVRCRFAPVLRDLGFKGSGTNFIRVRGEAVNAVNIQRSRSGDQAAVNLGLHFTFLPALWADVPKPAYTFKEVECDFRARLSPRLGYDHWWAYGLNEANAMASVDSMVETYVKFGEPQFLSYEAAQAVVDAVSPEALESGQLEQFPWHSLKPRLALTIARICEHLENSGARATYATIGLKHLGAATALMSKLQALAHAT